MHSSIRVLAGLAASAAMLAIGCKQQPPPDAYGNVEATEVVVAAEAAGQVASFTAQEGQRLTSGAVVGSIDATHLGLERDQLSAQREAIASRVNEVTRQIQVFQAQREAAVAQQGAATAQRAVLEAQLEIARRAYERTQRLFAQQAATSQQLDQAERDFRVVENQIKAQDQQILAQARQVAAQTQQVAAAEAQRHTVNRQVAGAAAQVAQVSERIRKSQIENPIAGTVLVTYVRSGEVVQPGQPLYKIADLAVVEVRAYVVQPQLAGIRLGQPAQVSVDVGSDRRQTLSGTVSWVSAQAEFTPTPIQTRDERADLVYAVKIRVPNEAGVLKIGMPVDVQFVKASASR